jgi:hypothetical protein
MSPAIGTSFRVSETQEIKNGRGRILARYLPEHQYRVTAANLECIKALVDAGLAVPGAIAPVKTATLTSGPAKLRGHAKTGKSR